MNGDSEKIYKKISSVEQKILDKISSVEDFHKVTSKTIETEVKTNRELQQKRHEENLKYLGKLNCKVHAEKLRNMEKILFVVVIGGVVFGLWIKYGIN